ncbi:uncharacterized mitochondrial protein-like protein [Tanacetum coccineum]
MADAIVLLNSFQTVTYLLDNGFQRGKIDKTLFIKRHKGDILQVQVYVDDIIFGLTKKELCNAFKKLMHEKFQMSSMGKLTFFLGLQVQQKKDGIFISQDKYVVEILKKIRFTEVKTASTPMETQKPCSRLASCVHDIMFAVTACARYQVNPKVSHLHAVKRIFRLISWQCKKQTVVANYTTEAKYVAASSCRGQVLWIQNQLLDYGYNFMHTKIFIDNNNEAVHKELGDSLVWAATTASSLEAEQDSGNITKTQSKTTPNESSSLGTTLRGCPRCQETMGDTIAQTRFEGMYTKTFKDLRLQRHTLRSDEDRLKLNELMELCTTLQNRVLDLEKTKTTQQNEIASLKRRVKKLEKKRGRINVIDADEDITLVNVQDDADYDMFDVSVLNGGEVFVAGQNENVVEEVVNTAQVSTAATTVAITTKEITLAQALEALKTSKPKIDVDHQLAERLQAQEQEELSDAEKAILFQQLLEKRRNHFAAKRVEERRNKPPTKDQQRQIICTYLKNMEGYKLKDSKSKGFHYIQEMFDKAFKRVNTFEDFRTELVEGKEKRAKEKLM